MRVFCAEFAYSTPDVLQAALQAWIAALKLDQKVTVRDIDLKFITTTRILAVATYGT
jgi:hypothetical protein